MNRRSFLRHSALLASGLMVRNTSHGAPMPGSPATNDAAASGLLDGLSEIGDLRLPEWGPYTKAWAGVSHLPDVSGGLRFDLAVFPGLYRRRQVVPNVTFESGFHPWSADPGLKAYTFRHVLDGLESLYADLTYRVIEGGTHIHAHFVNRTALSQQATLNLLAGIHLPEAGPYRQPTLRPARVRLPGGAAWIDGSHYAELVLDEAAPTRHLPDNAEIWGEIRGDGFVNGIGLGRGFGRAAGDRVTYRVPPGSEGAGTMLLVRWRLPPGVSATLQLSGRYVGESVAQGSGEFRVSAFTVGDRSRTDFTITPAGATAWEIDGCAIVSCDEAAAVSFDLPELDYRPQLKAPDATSALLSYAAVPGSYGLAWSGAESEVREWLTDRLDSDFPLFTHEHVRRVLDLGGRRHFTNVFLRPILLAPGGERHLHAVVCHGRNDAETETALHRFVSTPENRPTPPSYPTLPIHTAAGRVYAYGVERLAATLATNVVYPVRRRGRFVRHYTPGRWWDSLYTWDSGFIGLGLLELDAARSVDNLAAYLTSAEDDCAFVHHGSPVPVQVYQLQALWNRTQNRAMLRRFFPGVRRMHRFLVGRSDGSTTGRLRSGLIRTWDYFYNSGGWDDYPPQKYIRGTALTATIAPVVNSSHAVRTARILRELALLVGESVAEFDADIVSLGEALQKHSWNPDTGWFSYVRHDSEGRPVGPLLHKSGTDFNRGLDGIYPLIAGICTAEQEALFIRRLRDREVFWTRCGLTTVDQSAPYFRDDGYWNGTVWMPHQWFFWKTLLDLGEGDLAWQVARTALQTWENEVRATGCSFEHFVVKSGRGAGWHQFGGLSTPVLSWFATHFSPGSVTGGFNCWVLKRSSTADVLRVRLRLTGEPSRSPVLVAVHEGRSGESRARWNNVSVQTRELIPGTIEVTLPTGMGEGELVIG